MQDANTELEYALSTGPVEAEAPFVDPPVDLGYTPPPLEPVSAEDPFAHLGSVAETTLETQLQDFYHLPAASCQSALGRLPVFSQGLGAERLSIAYLATCPQSSLNQFLSELMQLANQPQPEDTTPEESAALQLLAQILISESLRREG